MQFVWRATKCRTEKCRCFWTPIFAIPTFRDHRFQYCCFDVPWMVPTSRDETASLTSRLPTLSCCFADHPEFSQVVLFINWVCFRTLCNGAVRHSSNSFETSIQCLHLTKNRRVSAFLGSLYFYSTYFVRCVNRFTWRMCFDVREGVAGRQHWHLVVWCAHCSGVCSTLGRESNVSTLRNLTELSGAKIIHIYIYIYIVGGREISMGHWWSYKWCRKS
jgi:hypothetical protein